MQRYFIYLAYDGTAYHGWQIQPNGTSVQARLMKALSTLLRREVDVVGAGRTDAGVHASLMVAHFDSDAPLDTVLMADKLNRLLPPDISVYRLRAVKQDAHARFDATARTYRYYVTTVKTPFNRQYRCRLFQTPDFERMNEAAQILFDYTDFTSFSKLHTDVKTNTCPKGAYSAVIAPSGKCCFNITGNPGMATGGCGDVLTGVLLALLAQGYEAETATRLGAYVHGLAGDVARSKRGVMGMTAGDVVACLPEAWKSL